MKNETKVKVKYVAIGAGVAFVVGAAIYFKKTSTLKKVIKEAGSAAGTKLTLGRFGADIKAPTEKLSALGFKSLDVYDGAYEMVTEYGMSVGDFAKAAEALKELDGVNDASKVFTVFNVQREGGTFGRYIDKFASGAITNNAIIKLGKKGRLLRA